MSFFRGALISGTISADVDDCSQETKKLHDESKKYFDSINGTLFLERELAVFQDPYSKA